MGIMNNNLAQILKKQSILRLIIFIGICALLFIMKDMLNIMLLTFIFTYFINRCEQLITKKIKKRDIRVDSRIIIMIIFILMVAVIALIIIGFLPDVIGQLKDIIKEINNIYTTKSTDVVMIYLKKFIDKIYSLILSSQGINYITASITTISKIGFTFGISLILSLFFLLGKSSVIEFTQLIKESKLALIYTEVAYLGRKFLDSFGKVIEVQIIIAFVNGIISMIGLQIIDFPNILGFGMMIMVLGLIPVAGVMISLIPLCLVAFSYGGFIYVVYILIMIAVIHAFESYILNPKLMSSKTKIPVFYTFVVLIVSEHFAGVWGLLFGMPMFVFILDILEVPIKNKDL